MGTLVVRGPGSPGRLIQAGLRRFRNMSGETVYPYKLMRISTWYLHSKYGPVPEIVKPNSFGSLGDYIINGPDEVPDLEYGIFNNEYPLAVELGIPTPTGGARLYYGPISGSWDFHANVGGFRSIGSYGAKNILVPETLQSMRCILGEDLLPGEATYATPTFFRAPSTWEEHSATIIVREALGTTLPIPADSVVWVNLDHSSGQYMVTAVGCE